MITSCRRLSDRRTMSVVRLSLRLLQAVIMRTFGEKLINSFRLTAGLAETIGKFTNLMQISIYLDGVWLWQLPSAESGEKLKILVWLRAHSRHLPIRSLVMTTSLCRELWKYFSLVETDFSVIVRWKPVRSSCVAIYQLYNLSTNLYASDRSNLHLR